MADSTRQNQDPNGPAGGLSSGLQSVSPIQRLDRAGGELPASKRNRAQGTATTQTQSRPAKRRKARPEGFAYFIGADAGPIKIGWSSNRPEKRLKDFQTGNPDELYIWGCVEGPRGLEDELHVRVWRHRIRGEWFDRDAALDLLADVWIEGTLTEEDELAMAVDEIREAYAAA